MRGDEKGNIPRQIESWEAVKPYKKENEQHPPPTPSSGEDWNKKFHFEHGMRPVPGVVVRMDNRGRRNEVGRHWSTQARECHLFANNSPAVEGGWGVRAS